MCRCVCVNMPSPAASSGRQAPHRCKLQKLFKVTLLPLFQYNTKLCVDRMHTI